MKTRILLNYLWLTKYTTQKGSWNSEWFARIPKHSKITLCGIFFRLANVTNDSWKRPKFYIAFLKFFFKALYERQVSTHTSLDGKSWAGKNCVETWPPPGPQRASWAGGQSTAMAGKRGEYWQRRFTGFPFINARTDKSIHSAHASCTWTEVTIKCNQIRAVIFHTHFQRHKLIHRVKAGSKPGDIKPLISTLYSYCTTVQISELALFRASLNLRAEAGFIRVCE